MEFKILGNGSAAAILSRHPSAFVIKIGQYQALIDCGEGTQYQILKHKIRPNRFQHIFISHLHGDHYFGLIGLLTSMSLQQRKEPLTIYGSLGLEEIITTQLKYSDSKLNYELSFCATNPNESICLFEDEKIKINSFPLSHRIPCTGFEYIQKPGLRHLLVEKLPADFPDAYKKLLCQGRNVIDSISGKEYMFGTYTSESQLEKKLVYASDTIYDPEISRFFTQPDLLYHEATFADDLIERATYTYHSTASQAAQIAHLVSAQKLIIGHFSSRYHDLARHQSEARSIFSNTHLAIEGDIYSI